MRRIGILSFTICLVLGSASSVRADDQAELKALVDKAIKAAGGEEKLTKFKATTWKSKGTFHGMGVAIPYTSEWASQGATQFRALISSEIDGNKFTFAIVLNGDKGWRKLNDQAQEMDKDMLAEQKEERHADYLATLVPLKDKAITLGALGDSKINNRAAVGVKVSQKGFRDVLLFFDKENYRLLKSEYRVKDDMSGKEVNQEVTYSDYKEVDGIKYPTKFVIKRDNKPYVEDEITEYKPVEKLDDSVFAKP